MSTNESNKDVVRAFIDRVYTQLDPTGVDELVADDFTADAWPDADDAKQTLRESTARMAQALDEIRFEIHDMIGEGDRVAVRLTASARQIGDFMGMPPSNRRYEIGEIHIFRLRDGKIVEHWHELDAMGLMKQLKPE
jgi:steroid delta-isomerase-like uncharacterized protein